VTEYVSTWGSTREPLGEVEWNILHSLVSDPPSYLAGWVAYVDEVPAGTVLVVPGPSTDLVEMSRLFVLPEYRRLGVATALLDELHAWATTTNAPAIYLFVQTKRTAARQLYASLGYEETVAGIGNIYADEILFASAIHPETRCGDLGDAQVTRLARSIVEVLSEGIATGGSSMRDYIDAAGQTGNYLDQARVFGRTGEPCRVCGAQVVKIRVAGRGTHLCPVCQTNPRAEH
jgi:GNAT superfamily N-acetyltransferase